MSRNIPVRGLKEVDAVLSALPERMQRQAYRAALTAAAAVIRDEARLRAPKKSGKMAKSIKSGSPRQNEDGTFSVRVRPAGEHAFLALFHEYGTAAHFITAGDSGISARLTTRSARNEGLSSDVDNKALKIGDNYITGAILHPGHAAQPFMRPALDIKGDEAVQAFADRIKRFLGEKTGFNARALNEAA